MTYPAKDGTKIPMFVRFPKGCAPGENTAADPCPVVVEFHGGPEAQATPGFSTYAQMFVDAGFVYVEPNVRGSDGYGKTWLDADNGAKRLDVISDIDDAGQVDPRELGPQREGAEGRRHGRQLRRLLDARRDDDVRGHVRRGRRDRGDQQPRDVSEEHGALSAHPPHLGVRGSRTRTPRR